MFFYFLFLSIAASASELNVKVIDPQSAAVPGAHVSLIRPERVRNPEDGRTSAEGTAKFALPDSGSFQVQSSRAGICRGNPRRFRPTEITVKLRLATASETVVVTATRTPVTGEVAGADVNPSTPSNSLP